MMGWDGWGHMSGWGWLGMTVGAVLFLGLLVLGAVLLVRVGRPSKRSSDVARSRSAEQVLAERFARGEMDEEEYRRRLATLTDTGPSAH